MQQGYGTAEPLYAAAEGAPVDAWLLADQGWNTYSTTIETRDQLIEEDPDLVRRFVDASIEGWYNFLYGDRAAAYEAIIADNPELTVEKLDAEMAQFEKLGIIDTGDALENGIGAIDAERVRALRDLAVKAGIVEEGAVDVEAAVTDRFVNKGHGLEIKHGLTGGRAGRPMRVLVVFCHPSAVSFGATLYGRAREALARAGHEMRCLDLYRLGFDPVLSEAEWTTYLSDTGRNFAGVAEHVEAMRWAEALVLIFPNWMYGPPAMLKGWLERVWLPGVAFEVAEGRRTRARGCLTNIRRFVVVTTSGSPWWWLRLIRDPGRSMLARGYRVLFHPRCRVCWLQLHDMNHATQAARERFLTRVDRALAAL